MTLKKPKVKGGKKVTRVDKKKEAARVASRREQRSDEEDGSDDEDVHPVLSPRPSNVPAVQPAQKDEQGPDDPNSTVPIPRYNAMLAVLRSTLYM